jgi:hypothetical protein
MTNYMPITGAQSPITVAFHYFLHKIRFRKSANITTLHRLNFIQCTYAGHHLLSSPEVIHKPTIVAARSKA